MWQDISSWVKAVADFSSGSAAIVGPRLDSDHALSNRDRNRNLKRKRPCPLSPDSRGVDAPAKPLPNSSTSLPVGSDLREMSAGDSTPIRKRQKAAEGANIGGHDETSFSQGLDGLDLEQTPRPSYLGYPTRNSSPSSSPTKSRSSSRYSGRQTATSSSARRKFVQLPLLDEGIVRAQFLDSIIPDLPTTVQAMLQKIRSLHRGRGVLSPIFRNDPSFAPFLSLFDLDETVFANPEEPASHLTVADVERIIANAHRCFVMGHDEPVWNVEVHNALLTAAIRGNSLVEQLGDFSLCTTASIIKEYLPAGASDKKVDFCMYINPSADTDDQIPGGIGAFRTTLPESSLNHSSYGALCPYPISVSLETKRPGNGLDEAALQVGIWQAAQWKMLRQLLRQTAPDRLRQRGRTSATFEEIEAYVQEELTSLGALHGVIIQGHFWTYIATTPEFPARPETTPSSRTILWLQKIFGDTDSAMGVHQVAAFLAQLNHWSTTVYWPWYKRCFLY